MKENEFHKKSFLFGYVVGMILAASLIVIGIYLRLIL